MICPECGRSPAMRGILNGMDEHGEYADACTHPCHQAAVDVVEAAAGPEDHGWIGRVRDAVAALLATLEQGREAAQ